MIYYTYKCLYRIYIWDMNVHYCIYPVWAGAASDENFVQEVKPQNWSLRQAILDLQQYRYNEWSWNNGMRGMSCYIVIK